MRPLVWAARADSALAPCNFPLCLNGPESQLPCDQFRGMAVGDNMDPKLRLFSGQSTRRCRLPRVPLVAEPRAAAQLRFVAVNGDRARIQGLQDRPPRRTRVRAGR